MRGCILTAPIYLITVFPSSYTSLQLTLMLLLALLFASNRCIYSLLTLFISVTQPVSDISCNGSSNNPARRTLVVLRSRREVRARSWFPYSMRVCNETKGPTVYPDDSWTCSSKFMFSISFCFQSGQTQRSSERKIPPYFK